MTISYIFESKALQNLPKLEFLVWKWTIWQHSSERTLNFGKKSSSEEQIFFVDGRFCFNQSVSDMAECLPDSLFNYPPTAITPAKECSRTGQPWTMFRQEHISISLRTNDQYYSYKGGRKGIICTCSKTFEKIQKCR
jgi:hypothetical protein